MEWWRIRVLKIFFKFQILIDLITPAFHCSKEYRPWTVDYGPGGLVCLLIGCPLSEPTLPLLESKVGSAEVTIYHAVVVGNGFAVSTILIDYLPLPAFMLLVPLNRTLLTEELRRVFKGDSRDTLETLNELQLV